MLSQILYAMPFLAQGFAITLWVSLLVVVLSLIAGVALGVGLVYGPAPLRWAVRIFSDTIRGIPILVLMFFVYYG
ncbi:MAG: amino acid ABC transporter permease, partial [Mesorhizobium sp.]